MAYKVQVEGGEEASEDAAVFVSSKSSVGDPVAVSFLRILSITSQNDMKTIPKNKKPPNRKKRLSFFGASLLGADVLVRSIRR